MFAKHVWLLVASLEVEILLLPAVAQCNLVHCASVIEPLRIANCVTIPTV